jgi:hypothetical protein
MSWNFQIHYSYLLNNIICRKKDNCDIYILLNHCASHIFWYIVFGWIYLWNQCLSPLKFRVRTPLIERCIHCIYDWSYLTIGCYSIQQYVVVCRWHATGCWFFPGTPVSLPIKLTVTIWSKYSVFVGGSWWHWMFFYLQSKRNRTSLHSPIDGKE